MSKVDNKDTTKNPLTSLCLVSRLLILNIFYTFEHILHFFLVFLLLNLNMYLFAAVFVYWNADVCFSGSLPFSVELHF